MKVVRMTDPFTGLSFFAERFEDGTIIAKNPLTDEQIRMTYNAQCDRYQLNRRDFKLCEALKLKDAAKVAGLTLQALSNACSRGTMPFHELPNGDKVILLKDAESYRDKRKEKQCEE